MRVPPVHTAPSTDVSLLQALSVNQCLERPVEARLQSFIQDIKKVFFSYWIK